MLSSRTVISAALVLLIPIGAAAQGDKPATTPPKTPGTPTKAASDERPGHWLASGFVGSNFGNNAQPASTAFGGALGYLFHDRWGAELDAGITPDFALQNNAFGAGVTPRINSYMANGIWSTTLGAGSGGREWQPFVSGGVGALSLRSGLVANSATNSFNPDDSRFGANIGGGVMAFSGSWGFKADVRYFRAAGSYNATPATYTPTLATMPSTLAPTLTDTSANALANAALSGLHFWRANVGVAIRW
ncbi:MAG TPA: hypothetical protein VGY57_14180 [Vicinamibacterales bacterium]|nr:hypothetical protein [Vicinamibacterales bacterium]